MIQKRKRPILAEIRDEQEHGRDKYGSGPHDFSHDDGHIPSDWLDMIEDHRQRARFETPMEWRQRMIKIAGLAVSAVESFDRKQVKEKGMG